MPKLARFEDVPDEVAIIHIRMHIASLPPEKEPEFKIGQAVRLDTGDLGVVSGHEDGSSTVYYLRDGIIGGPAFGFTLTKLDL